MGVLTVKLIKVLNLRDADGVGSSDPYVKFDLEQDNFLFDKDFGKQQSSKKADTLDPEYNETFTFKDVPSLKNMVLNVRILDDDIGFDDQIGNCQIDLEDENLSSQPVEIEAIVDKKNGEKSWFETALNCVIPGVCCIMPIVKCLFGNLFSQPATIYLELSFEE